MQVLPAFEYRNHFLGRNFHISSEQRAQVDSPLHLIKAAAVRLHLPRGYPLEHEQLRSPSDYMPVSLLPAELQRAAISFAVAASHGLATAPTGVDVSARMTRHWRTRILLRIMRGLITKIQVRFRLLLRFGYDAHLCQQQRCMHVQRHASCVVVCFLTGDAANTGGLQVSVPRLSSSRLQGLMPF